MVITLIKVDSGQLLETFRNANAISTLCLHMCQHILSSNEALKSGSDAKLMIEK